MLYITPLGPDSIFESQVTHRNGPGMIVHSQVRYSVAVFLICHGRVIPVLVDYAHDVVKVVAGIAGVGLGIEQAGSADSPLRTGILVSNLGISLLQPQ